MNQGMIEVPAEDNRIRANSMKVFITGYPGFLGRHLARAFKRNGFQIRVLLHRKAVRRKDFCQEADELLWGSITDQKAIREGVDGVDAVVHAAWAFRSFPSERSSVNEKGTDLLFKESIRSGVGSFAFISSVAVYGMDARADLPLTESSLLAAGDERIFLYPLEKIACERMLLASREGGLRIGIFRPGPIFDDEKGPVKKVIAIGKHSFALGIGNGRNRMAFIHAEDVSEAVVKWVKNGKDGIILNITPTVHLRYRDWYFTWAEVQHLRMTPVFIRGFWIRLANCGVKMLKRWMGKKTGGDVEYAIAAATRDMEYSNEALKSTGWRDEATARYTDMKTRKNHHEGKS